MTLTDDLATAWMNVTVHALSAVGPTASLPGLMKTESISGISDKKCSQRVIDLSLEPLKSSPVTTILLYFWIVREHLTECVCLCVRITCWKVCHLLRTSTFSVPKWRVNINLKCISFIQNYITSGSEWRVIWSSTITYVYSFSLMCQTFYKCYKWPV